LTPFVIGENGASNQKQHDDDEDNLHGETMIACFDRDGENNPLFILPVDPSCSSSIGGVQGKGSELT
jgi:hypothetical protein